MANCSAYNEQVWVLKLPAAGHCMPEATVDLLQLASDVAKGITGTASGLKICSCVSLLLCVMTQPVMAVASLVVASKHGQACWEQAPCM